MLSHGAEREALRTQLVKAHEQVRSLEAKLVERDTHDPRTRLLVLDAFLEAAELALRACDRESAPFSAAVIDIDGFRELNARRGRMAGDAALIGIASRLRRLTRAGDVLGRSGADEITVVMPSTGLDGARTCCDRLIHELEEGDLPGAGVVSVSAGGVRRTPPARRSADVLAAAQAGVDRARALGGGRSAVRIDDGTKAHDEPCAGRGRRGARRTLLARIRSRASTRSRSSSWRRRGQAARHQPPRDRDRRRRAAHLHDIGKVAIPDRALNKPGLLDDTEWDLMREHPVIGERILRATPERAPSRGSCATSTSTGTAPATPTTSPATRSRSQPRIILACDAYSAMTTIAVPLGAPARRRDRRAGRAARERSSTRRSPRR